jgi:hypothetical protein
VTLPGSFEVFGRVIDILARTAPFADGPLAPTAKTVRQQIKHGRYVAAVTEAGDIIAYMGWVPTLRASAELWIDDRGPLQVRNRGYDALALNIVVSPRRDITTAMIRHARESNGTIRVYFKRVYSAGLRQARKGSVTNIGGSPSEADDV